jgi:hypothetical protein
MGYRSPTPPPFAVGERVRYNSVEFGHGDPIRWLRHGAIGVVIANHPGSAATGLVLEDGYIDDEPLDGWSAVRYLNDRGFDRAVTVEAVREGQFARVPK